MKADCKRCSRVLMGGARRSDAGGSTSRQRKQATAWPSWVSSGGTACVHAQPACQQAVPPLTSDNGHAVACFRWREVLPPAALRVKPPINTRLQRLQSAFIS